MHRKSSKILPFIITILVIAVGYFGFTVPVQAEKYLYTNAILSGQVIDGDVFLTGENPSIQGIVNGDVFVIGTDVSILGDVNGSVFVLAEKLDLSGMVRGNLYVAAVEVNQPAEGRIDRSLYAFTLSLITERGSTIGRDLNLVALSARLRGQTSGKTSAIIGPWEIFKVFRDYFSQNITGFTPRPASLAWIDNEHIPLSAGVLLPASIRQEENEDPSALVEWLLNIAKSLLYFIVIGGLILWLFPRQFKGWADKVKQEPLTSAGYGIIVLINGYLIPVLGFFLILALLLGLLYLSLPSLAWTFFWIGSGILITLFAVFQAAITFISKAIVAYLIGSLILSKFKNIPLQYAILPLLLGLLIYVPLSSIPYLGFLVGLVATLLGLGAIWLTRKTFLQNKEVSAVEN